MHSVFPQSPGGFAMKNVGLDEIDGGKKERICKDLTDICPLLATSDRVVLNHSYLYPQSLVFVEVFKWPAFMVVLYEMTKKNKSSKIKVTP